ncbi:(Fe-S)-binding protein [Deltaproteobacteria bacterium]|nr:(Fe-S)-binding protein [Deltaproteobacteria bacterium]
MTLADFKYGDIIHRCFRCGYCKFPVNWMDVNNCPAYARYRMETYSCGGRLWLTRAWLMNEIQWTDHLAHILYSCTACKNCEVKCPLSFNVDILNMIRAAKEEMVEQGKIPTEARDFLENIQVQGNPYGMPKSKRGDWMEETPVEIYQEQEYLYSVGCVGAYDTRAQEAARKLGSVLQKCGVSFGVLGKDERCDGNEVNNMGEEALFEMMAQDNITHLNGLGVGKIVTLSPHSFNTIKNDYPRYGGDFETFHYTQLLQKLIEGGQLNPAKERPARVTYHDPCFLGRWNNLYDSPRRVLKAIPGVTLVEMERNRENALCCGGGGGNFCMDLLGGSPDSPSRRRVREALTTGAGILAVACPKCLTILEDAVKVEGLDDKLIVKDIAEIACEACGIT